MSKLSDMVRHRIVFLLLPTMYHAHPSCLRLCLQENCAIGVICGVSDTTLLQSTNYYKNAQQQRLPMTLDPRVLYRGYTVNTLQNGFCVMSQFFLNGVIQNFLTGGS